MNIKLQNVCNQHDIAEIDYIDFSITIYLRYVEQIYRLIFRLGFFEILNYSFEIIK